MNKTSKGPAPSDQRGLMGLIGRDVMMWKDVMFTLSNAARQMKEHNPLQLKV